MPLSVLNNLFSSTRTGSSQPTNSFERRSVYQRDFDRIIFSSAFRRLQNKTQVFPLPGSILVHNRLTHSLEVASVGRSLGNLVGHRISEEMNSALTEESLLFYKYDFYNVLASACLCHDIGNPPFGHAGEDAIANFFRNNSELKPYFTESEWADYLQFDGNANAIRVLTYSPKHPREGGLQLTHTTLAAMAKYPCESIASDKNYIYRKKFGFFQTEKELFSTIANSTAMLNVNENPLIYYRHPFVWLVEVADDICYNIIDLEDAHRLGIIEFDVCFNLLRLLLKEIGLDNQEIIDKKLDSIYYKNDKISYLRAKIIAALTNYSAEVYINHLPLFLNGNFPQSILDTVVAKSEALKQIIHFSIENVYNHVQVVEIENAGYNIMGELLSFFIPSVLRTPEQRNSYDKKVIRLLPYPYNSENKDVKLRVQGVVDYIASMTDDFATNLYRRIKGIDMGMKFTE
ncbi:MAG TPA: dNTP triphosphohydrolase [Bacteroidales bacterium]|nr:dNTP triphosphohydrolase [Bacteroidales bacterium]HOS58189.1 dNTP triphosphohydrolase [Bacteroidales bacterium]HRR04553.1 dNTP triphosphohydrolase [Bacteroidales bacterium]HRT13618.1 dNTP triphosphohydrolase [Bacteroidales bacterium]HXK74227.1 dNTP triphosphohydrolase [Bacteroidales bacterium]